MDTRAIGLFAGGLLAATAAAQTIPDAGIVMTVNDPVLLPGQSTTITLSAAWEGVWPHADDIAVVGTSLLGSAGSTGLSAPTLIEPMSGPGTLPGVLSPAGVDGILAAQLNFPGGIIPDPYPLPFWEVTYTAPTDVASAFEVDFATLTTRFDAYPDIRSSATISLLDHVVEGSATIRVVPAPASTLVLAIGLLTACRQRRN
jgi:hypothetical protein